MPTGWRSERGDSWGAGAGVRAGFGDEAKPELSRKGRKEVGKEGGVGVRRVSRQNDSMNKRMRCEST